jgi:hypothetical protein
MKSKTYKKLGDLRGKRKDIVEVKLAKKKVRRESKKESYDWIGNTYYHVK